MRGWHDLARVTAHEPLPSSERRGGEELAALLASSVFREKVPLAGARQDMCDTVHTDPRSKSRLRRKITPEHKLVVLEYVTLQSSQIFRTFVVRC